VHRSLFIRQSVGRIEDKYEIGARLGRGRYGEVFLVTTQSTRERRVCKRVRHQQQRVPTEELVDEVGLLRGLDHPHICKIFEYFESDEYVEMIMEPAFGGTLAQLVNGLYRNDAGEHFGQRPMELTEAWVATMLAQLLGALTYAHEVVGVIHKDLKSENILLVGKSGLKAVEVLEQPVHAMLADFGIAEVFVPESVVIMGTNSESLDVQRCSSRAMALEIGKPFEWKIQCSRAGGTPPYMSPEVFRGSFTEKCDIWSLGVVVFHVMTGELPYRGENLLHQIHIVSDPRQHPRWSCCHCTGGAWEHDYFANICFLRTKACGHLLQRRQKMTGCCAPRRCQISSHRQNLAKSLHCSTSICSPTLCTWLGTALPRS